MFAEDLKIKKKEENKFKGKIREKR